MSSLECVPIIDGRKARRPAWRSAHAAVLALLIAAPVALADGPGADEPVPGWQQGLRAVLIVVAVVAIAVVARRLGSRASSWSANRRRGEDAEEDAND